MPSAERQLLEIELEQMSQSTDTSTFLNGNSITDLSMSWEYVRSPVSKDSNPATSSNTRPNNLPGGPESISRRSGAPRFGGAVSRKPSASSAFTAVREMFDSISYEKGCAFIRTLVSHLGRDVFLKGISAYLKKHSYGNTKAADLWTSLSEACGQDLLPLVDCSQDN